MDVFHVGASAPKAPESKSVDRDGVQRSAGRPAAETKPRDAFASSPDAAAVTTHVRTLSELSEVREDVIRGVSELLGHGLLDTTEAAQRAAEGILDA